jgi:hypothetical protein
MHFDDFAKKKAAFITGKQLFQTVGGKPQYSDTTMRAINCRHRALKSPVTLNLVRNQAARIIYFFSLIHK